MAILQTKQVWKRPRTRKAWNSVNTLSLDEEAHVRRALIVLHAQHGEWTDLALVMNVHAENLLRLATSEKHHPTAGLALRAARIAGVPVEDVLSGEWPKPLPGPCPTCGYGSTRGQADGKTARVLGRKRRR